MRPSTKKKAHPKKFQYLLAEEKPYKPPRPDILSKNPHDVTLVFFDLETTGGNPHNSGVTEIGAVKYQNGKEIGQYQTLVNPKRHISSYVKSITGISNEMVKDSPAMEEVIEDFLEFIGDGILVSHGAMADFAFIQHYAQKNKNIELDNFYICTHLLVSHFLRNIPSKSLSGVAEYFQVQNLRAHRALVDAEMTTRVFWKIFELLEDSGYHTIEDLLKIQADHPSLKRLGPGISSAEVERAPTNSGLFYLFNSRHEIIYLGASQNIRRGLRSLTELTDEKEFNQVVVDVANHKYERHSHFLNALLKEKRELTKLSLSIDPRRFERRASHIVQVIIPEDMLDAAYEQPEFAFFLDMRHNTSGMHTDDIKNFRLEEIPESVIAGEEFSGPVDDSAVLIRKTRPSYLGSHTQKFLMDRRNVEKSSITVGFLKEGVGWAFAGFESTRIAKGIFEELHEHFPFCDTALPMGLRFWNLKIFISTLTNGLHEEIKYLEDERNSFKNLMRFAFRSKLKKLIDHLKVVQSKNYVLEKKFYPKSGMAVISNNETKELEIFIVIRNSIRRQVKLGLDEAGKLKSSRYFTRLFAPYIDEITNLSAPETFSHERCDDIELYIHWMKHRGGEGEWVDFEQLQALYDPSLI